MITDPGDGIGGVTVLSAVEVTADKVPDALI